MDDKGRSGQFAPGHAGGPGRPKGATITSELRRQCDPAAVARFLIDLVDNVKASHKDRLRAAELITDRLEGRAVAINLTGQLAPAQGLPENWDQLSPDQRREYLVERRQRSLESGR